MDILGSGFFEKNVNETHQWFWRSEYLWLALSGPIAFQEGYQVPTVGECRPQGFLTGSQHLGWALAGVLLEYAGSAEQWRIVSSLTLGPEYLLMETVTDNG